MSIIETPTVDCVHQRGGGGADHHRASTKRKFDDFMTINDDGENYVDSCESCDLVSVRMRKDEPKTENSCNSETFNGSLSDDVGTRISGTTSYACSSRSESTRPRSKLHFFIRLMPEGKTLVLEACPKDTVKSIHERIQATMGIPLFEQRLIYKGKQLQWEQTLAECAIEKDCHLQLVGRMRSTEHPQAWQVINDMVSLIWRLCQGEVEHNALKTIKSLMSEYLRMTSRIDNDTASGYFQIFLSSSAPVVLVMLYMSPHVGNKECADCSIRHFMSSCRSTLSKSLHTKCACVVLEFCKLLRRAGPEDPLYVSCRSTFGSLLEAASISYVFESHKGLILIDDIFPFVREIANRLLRALDMSMESPTSVGPSPSDVRDFTAFILPLRSRINKQQAFKSLCSSKSDEKLNKFLLLVEDDSIHLIFSELLQKMDHCLHKMQEILSAKERDEGDNLYSAWSQYLSILKELYHLSKLYKEAEDEFQLVLERRKSMLVLLITQYAKRTDDHQWILEHKWVTNFESRRHLVMMMFPDVKEDYEELHEMLIDRSQLLAESFEYIARAEPESLHAGLFMEFKNEEATGPGVLREWFFLVCQALFNPQNALFVACPNDRRRFLPNPASKVHPLHLDYFTFSGRVVALALMHRVQVGIVLDRVFFMQLAGYHTITLEDIRDADPYLYSSCKQILEMGADFIDSDALGLTFVREVEELGHRKVVELCPGGKSLVVNSKNRKKYVDLLIQDRFVTSISEQVSHFAQGFADILSNPRFQQFFFKSLDLEDLDWMLHGSDKTISVEDWKAHTEYNGYKETDPQISWFWEIVGQMSAEQRKVLLFFWTSLKYLPVEGFKGLSSRLYLYNSMETHDRLPSSHTCFFRLCFPPYPSFSVMQDRLRIITQEHIGSSFGTW